ncbi:MAG TPA: DUF4263 domain-containing protein, partial [Fimbriimonadaceae bacterium]|nr:DUF4263 domain-containing protein [Fimbriimonadaceae bacterium]
MSSAWDDIPDGSEIVWTRDGLHGTEVAERQLTKDNAQVTKRIRIRRIPHNTTEPGITIQFERQSQLKKDGTPRADAEKDCSLAINEEETQRLLAFLQEAEVLRLKGIKEAFKGATLEDIWGALLSKATQSDRAALEQILRNGPDVPEIVGLTLEHHRRSKETARLRQLISNGAVEREFQAWFEANPWVFQADAVTCLDERRIDVEHIADLLFSSVDGCVDLIELKRPTASFWSASQDHDNWVPHSDLTKALTQVWNYQRELEKEMERISTQKRLGGAVILRPHATLVHGSSGNWQDAHFEAQRL